MKLLLQFSLVCFLLLSTGHAQKSPAPASGDRAPDLHLSVFKPDSVEINDWSDLAGKVVVIDFWATWCTPCIASFPHLNQLVKAFSDKDIVFISLTYEPGNLISPFLEKHKLNTIIATDTSFAMFRSYDAWAIPQVILVNKEGIIVSKLHPEYLTSAILEDALAGEIPDVEQVPGGLFDPKGAEEHFRSFLQRPK
ncbi:MAG: TlpA family protein disulfide reductase [Calditrichia bacterium]